MSDNILNSLLRDYSEKKLYAEMELDAKKIAIYKNIPVLEKIDLELSELGLQIAKNTLFKKTENIKHLKLKVDLLKLEKDKILKDHNINYSYSKPSYECNQCNDTGYVSNLNASTEMCKCLKQKLLDESFAKSNLAHIKDQNFSTFNYLLFSDEVDLSKYSSNVSPRDNILRIKESCLEFIDNFDDPKTKNLLFSGNTGLR